MTDQDLFNQVVVHAQSQKEQSLEDGLCLYRGPKGLKCFIGALIPDNVWDEEMENTPITHLLVIHPEIRKLLKDNTSDLLTDLQKAHDLNFPAEWPQALKTVAETYNLSTEILEAF